MAKQIEIIDKTGYFTGSSPHVDDVESRREFPVEKLSADGIDKTTSAAKLIRARWELVHENSILPIDRNPYQTLQNNKTEGYLRR